MKLDIQEISHNYITRLVIFSVFLFKNHRKDEVEYARMISDYIKKKIRYQIDIKITCGPKYSLQEQREKSLEGLLSDEDIQFLNLVVIAFKTSHKEVILQVDVNDEDKYEVYLYS